MPFIDHRNSTLPTLCANTNTPAIKNKFAQILTLVLRLEYPHDWPDLFQSVFRLITDAPQLATAEQVVVGGVALGPANIVRVDLLLRLLTAIDSEIVARRESDRARHDVARTASIKDAMRTDCVPTIVDICYGVILAYSSPAAANWAGAEALVNAALSVLEVMRSVRACC
jgi:hypothetical protein